MMKPPECLSFRLEHESHEFLLLDVSLLIFLRHLKGFENVISRPHVMHLRPIEDN
jgi:hypothetical protein